MMPPRYHAMLRWAARLGRRPAGLAAGMRVVLDTDEAVYGRFPLYLVRADGTRVAFLDEAEDHLQADNVIWLLNRALAALG